MRASFASPASSTPIVILPFRAITYASLEDTGAFGDLSGLRRMHAEGVRGFARGDVRRETGSTRRVTRGEEPSAHVGYSESLCEKVVHVWMRRLFHDPRPGGSAQPASPRGDRSTSRP